MKIRSLPRRHPWIIALLTLCLITGCITMFVTTPPRELDRLKASPRFINGKFRNDAPPRVRSFKQNMEILWKFATLKNQQVPSHPLPTRPVDLSHFNTPAPKGLNTTWLGHSTLLIQVDGHRIITDPVLEKRVSLLGPSRFTPLPEMDLSHIRHVDLVLISHNHYDHLNRFSIQTLAPVTQRFLVPLGVGPTLEKWGVPREKIQELDWWDNVTLGDLTLTATPAQHFSGRTPLDANKTLWASWVIQGPAHQLFFSGDSAYFKGFKTIGEQFGPFDMTFLECGSYDALWADVHMVPEETVRAHLDLKGKILHPMHWGTFNLANHPWYDPMVRLDKAARKAGVPLATPVAGQTLFPQQNRLGAPWWTAHADTPAP